MRICRGESKIIRRANRKGIDPGDSALSRVISILEKEGFLLDDLPLDPSHCYMIEQTVSGSFGVRVAG